MLAADSFVNSTMMVRVSLVAGALLARTASAGLAIADTILVRAEDVLSTPYVSLVAAAEHQAAAAAAAASSQALVRRQQQQNQPGGDNNNATRPPDGIQLQPDGSLNLTAWNQETNNACVDALRSIQRASNPSGNCICYNLPSLDAKSGVFEAEMRLYKVSEPRGSWTGIKPSDINVSVSYTGASASPVKPETLSAKGMKGAMSSVIRRLGLQAREDHNPELLQVYMLVGQIDKKEMSDQMSMSALQSLIMPTLTLAATNTSGVRVATNVSLNEATFLNGVFSREVVQSDFSAAQAAVDDALAALHNGTAAFVLPGVQLMIFPVGLIITSIWLALGLAAYGMGTFERIQHAENYRTRKGLDASRLRGGKTF
ncbi:hypothetical protein V2A60_002803 [Cordyceps javanica]|uniref:Uncharacterized protein n=1 Tax=Cordyceps javanica TaxID=43265 RepID=A0A545UXG6_9HYPO|nr:hypothetical protein IF1G_07015 [Cordyceps javanica]TQW06014.1 hypothetical protein IF2G_06297 [Cordyceps javanica]